MNKLLTIIFVFPQLVFGQTDKSLSKPALANIYSQAISDFIKAANKKNARNFDTLFLGKRKNNQPDDFPDIVLPKTIENTTIRLISPEAATLKQKACQSCIYINLFGWAGKEKAEFIFVVFSNGFNHQYDYSIQYKYNDKQKEFELEKLQFKGPPFDR